MNERIERKGESLMKILMLTWEYPPRVVGGISRVVYDLSRTLLKDGHESVCTVCPWQGVSDGKRGRTG